MLQKTNSNNFMYDECQRFGLRKLSVGVASVMLGATYLALNNTQVAHADTNNDVQQAVATQNGGGVLQRKLAEADNSTQTTSQNNVNDENKNNQNNKETTTTLNVNNKAVTTFNDNKTEQNTETPQATNVNLELQNGQINADDSEIIPNKVISQYTQSQNVGYNDFWRLGIKGSFQLNSADINAGKKILIGNIDLSSNSQNGNVVIGYDGTNWYELKDNNNLLGHIYLSTINNSQIGIFLQPIKNANFVGTLSANINLNQAFVLNFPGMPGRGKVFSGLNGQPLMQNVTISNKKYTFSFSSQVNKLVLNGWDGLGGVSHSTSFDWVNEIGNSIIANSITDPNVIQDLNNTQGKNSTINHASFYEAAYRFSFDNFVPSTLQATIVPKIAIVNSQGQLLDTEVAYYDYTQGSDYWQRTALKVVNAGLGLTLNDLKAKSTLGTMLYSVQKDGSYLTYWNIPSSAWKVSKDDIANAVKASPYAWSDPAGINTVIAANQKLYNDGLGNQPLEFETVLASNTANNTIEGNNKVERLDINDGNVIAITSFTTPIDRLNLQGQAGIRVHYIDGQTGNDIIASKLILGNANANQLINHWNYNKTGYTLRTNGSNKLFNGKTVNGTVLNGTQDNNVILPAENTITDVNYIVDPQSQNITINYIDQTDNKQLKSDKISGYSDNKANYDVQSNIDNYKKQGYKLIKSEIPSVLQFDHDTSKDQVYNVYLGYDKEQAKISYIDDTTGKTLKLETAAGKVDSNIAFPTNVQDEIKTLEGQGYKLVSNSFNSPVYSSDANKNVFEVHFVHATSNVTQKVTIKRTINYLDKATNKAVAKPVTQTVTFDQPGVQDMVTGQVNWQSVDSQQFDEVTSPEVKGYSKPDKAIIEAQNVNVNNKDSTVNVYYTQDTPKLTITNNQDHKPTPEQETSTNLDTPIVNNGATVQLPTNTVTALQSNNKQALAQTNVQNSNSIIGLAMASGVLTLGLASINKKYE